MLKLNTNEVPEGLETYYTKQDDGSFRLQVEGVVAEAEHLKVKNDLTEFRKNNIALLKDNGTLNSFKDVLGGGNLTPDGISKKIEDLAKTRADSLVDEMRKAHKTELDEITKDRDNRKSRLSSLTLNDEVRKAGPKHGVLETAYDDVMYRAQNAWEVTDEGLKMKVEKLDAEGKAYTMETWMAETVKVAPHLAAQSKGIGAGNNIRKGSPISVNKNTDGMSGPDRIAAALANKGNPAPRLN